MNLITLDNIVRRTLLDKQLPLHWYIRFLSYAAACVRERHQDTLYFTKTVSLTLNSSFAADLPCDFESDVLVGVQRGQFVQPVTQRNSINNLVNTNSTGNPIPYGLPGPEVSISNFPFFPGFMLFSNVNDLGEPTGRLFGANTGYVNSSYKIIPGRNQIQFNEQFPSSTAVLEYIPNSELADNLSRVDGRAFSTVQAYIDWMWKKHSRRSTGYEIQEAKDFFGNEWRRLRAQMANVSLQDIRQSIFKSYNQGIKV